MTTNILFGFLLLSLMINVFLLKGRKKDRKDYIDTIDFFRKEKDRAENKLNQNQEENEIHKNLIFSIGDKIHNFGGDIVISKDENSTFCLNKKTCNKIQDIFVAIRYSSNHNSKNAEMSCILNLLNFNKDLKEEIKTFLRENEDLLIEKRVINSILELSLKRLLPEIGAGGYPEAYVNPKNLEELLNPKK